MDDLSNIAPKLSKIKKEQNFKVPKDYFDTFPSRLQDAIKQKNEPKALERFFLLLKPQLAVALLIIGFATITYFGYKIILSGNINPIAEQNIYPNEIMEIIENDPTDFEESTFIENMEESDFLEENEISEEENEIIQYLIDEDIDYSILIAQL